MIEKPLTFVGKIIADFTHEINNHLALIKESAGLIGDICRGKKSVDKKEMPYIIESLDAIENQIQRSVNFIGYFNRFAHRMDSLMNSFSLQAAVEELFELIKRYSNRKKVSLKYSIPPDISDIQGSPFLFEFLIFFVIDLFLKSSKPESIIALDAKRENGSIKITIRYEGELAESFDVQAQLSTLQDLLPLINAKITMSDRVAVIEIPV